MQGLRKLLRIVEVIALFLAGALLAKGLIYGLGMQAWLSQANEIIKATTVDFIALSVRTAVSMPLKYIGILIVIVVYLLFTKQKFNYKSLGFHGNKKSAVYILRSSLLLFCLAGILPKFMFYLWPTNTVGTGPETWQLLFDSWSIEFWVFMLTSSIILPPIFEELFFRGFTLSWLEKNFSVGWSIIIMALIFTSFHTQYFETSIISMSMIVSLLLSSILLGYSKYHTGTLIPGIIAHALVNIPIIGVPALWLSVFMLIYLLINYKRILRHWSRFKTIKKE